MPEWTPGELATLLGGIRTRGAAAQREGILLIAAAIEAKAIASLGLTSHKRNTPTPAGKGAPPALVTGTGRRSIITDPGSEGGLEMIVRVGTAAGVFPPRRRGSRQKKFTPSSQYLFYQETLDRFDHPFLKPAFDSVVTQDAAAIFLARFQVGFPTLF